MRHRYSTITLLLLGMILCVGTVAAQERQEISGTVTSADDNAPLPGANVSVPGTTIGTATNAQGAYTLSVPGDADSLRFSFVGFQAQTVPIAGRTTIDVALLPRAQQIEELVVVGYGVQESGDVTGSVQGVSEESFNQGNVANAEELISGKVAGVNISKAGGAPGAGSQIRIRGSSSVNAGSSPLFVIDGVPIDNAGNSAQRNPLNFLNPSDIEDVSVLKDASARAIYGSRGANGVIEITTKSGEGREPSLNYEGSVSSASVADRVDVLDANQFRRVVRQEEPGLTGLLGDANTDWQGAVERTAIAQEHNLGFSGGDESSNYRISLNYLDEQGVLFGENFERISGSFRYSRDFLDDALTIRTNLRGARQDRTFEPGVVGASASMAPTQPVRDPDSPFGGFFEWSDEISGDQLATNNPVASVVLTENTGKTYRSLGNVEAEYNLPFVEGLSTRVKLGYDVQEGENKFFAPSNLKAQAEAGSEAGQVNRNNFSRTNTLLNVFLEYNREFEEINSSIDFTGAYEYQDFESEFPEFSGRGLAFDFLREKSLAVVDSIENINGSIFETQNRLISGFGRLTYTFMDRYTATVTLRRDGSSRFGPGNRWGTFPSAAIGWRLYREPFLRDLDFLSNLKLRVSWGVNGNQEFGDFAYLSTVAFGDAGALQQFGDEFVTTVRPNAADPELQWEETASLNVGVDYGFFDGRLTGAIEYYQEDTDKLLFDVPIPGGSNLRDRLLTNIGSLENEGMEFSVDAQVIDRDDLSYNAQFTAATNDNEVTNVPRGGESGIDVGGISGGVGNTIQKIREGAPINSFFVLRHKKNDQGDPVTDGPGVSDTDMYVDQNGDGEIGAADRVIGESPQADWTFGHTSRATYQNFDLSFTLRAEVGNHVYNNVASNFGRLSRLTEFDPSNLHESVLTTRFNEGQFFSDYFVEDASFLRVDNISLGYNVPVEAIPKVDGIRIYGAAQNVFTITGYSGPDPEVPGGIDNQLFPRSRTFTAGVNVQL